MWATLGDFDIQIISSPSRLERRSGQDYVEIPLIQTAPQIQWMGPRLQELTLEIALHAGVLDIDAVRGGLEQLMADHEPVALGMGNGDDWGDWVITEQTLTGHWTTGDGALVAATMALSLKESPPDGGENDAQKSKRQAGARMSAAPKRSG